MWRRIFGGRKQNLARVVPYELRPHHVVTVAEGFQQGAEEAPEIVAIRGIECTEAVGLSFEKSRDCVLG